MMDFSPFAIARLPRILFGSGTLKELPGEARAFGTKALLITGARSFRETARWGETLSALEAAGFTVLDAVVEGEPSPDLVDDLVGRFKGENIDVVIAIGGGSALDGAKAVAGLLRPGNSVMDHLEGVGRGVPYEGPSVPFIAVPTTAGTGSEATKNAVLSRHGKEGFKKSFRHDELVARLAIVDPDLLESCPKSVLAANGMDAFTQLLESVTSTRANPMTDALGFSGLEAFRDGFFQALEGDGEGRAKLAYASLMSGINLAQTGLGAVHGLASPMGAFFPIPHGVVCGTLVAEATAVNIRALKERDPDGPGLSRYAHAASVLERRHIPERDEALDLLVALLRHWTDRLDLPRLSGYGVTEADIPRLVEASGGNSMKTNPLVLEDGEIAEIIRRRL